MSNKTNLPALALTPEQHKEAKELDKEFKRLVSLKDELADYKLGDFYIMEECFGNNPKQWLPLKGHMGFNVKFKVVYISPEGIPYLRKLTPNGKPTGDVYLPDRAQVLKTLVLPNQYNPFSGVGVPRDANYRFVPDPDQLDSILLQTDFQPTADHKDKLRLFNDINKHNKRVSVKTSAYAPNGGYKAISAFFKTKVAGDKFWTSPDNVFVIQSIQKVGKEWEIMTLDKNQQEKKFNYSSFLWKRLYSEQPRSFAKESTI